MVNIHFFHRLTKEVRTALFIAACLFFNPGTYAQLPGAGTETDPYLISNEADLVSFREFVHSSADASNGKFFKLTADINVTAAEWTPVGIQTTGEFKGILDGNGKVISGVRVNAPERDYQGFIGFTNSACVIKNLGLDDVQVAGRNYVGALGGRVGGTVTGCFATNITIAGNNTVGGLIGHTQTATFANPVRNCHAQGSVTGNDNVGGLLGYNSRLSVSDSSADVSVSGTGSAIGGLIGAVGGGRLMTVEKCLASGDVNVNSGATTEGVGGLIGKTIDGTALAGSVVRDCYTTGNVTATAATGVGGIFGYNNNSFDVEDSYASGNIAGYDYVGGVAGFISDKEIVNSVALNNAITSERTNVGRLSGYTSPPIVSDVAVKAGAYYFDGWTGLTDYMHLPYTLTNNYSEREPKWGWYTSTQEIVDEQIELAAEAGLSFFSFCWFYSTVDAQGSNPTTYLDNPRNRALQLFKQSPKRNLLEYSIMVTNHNPHLSNFTAEQWPNLINIWVEEFRNPQYLKVDGKPVIHFFDYWQLNSVFGGLSSKVKEAIDQLRVAAHAAGFTDGILVGMNITGTSNTDIDMIKRQGADFITQYNNAGAGYFGGTQNRYPIENLLSGERAKRNSYINKSDLDYIPVATLGWDPRPWNGADKNYYSGFSVNSVEASVRDVVEWVQTYPDEQSTTDKIAFLYAWNEYGEGGYLTPCKLGFNPLEGLKRALVTPETPIP